MIEYFNQISSIKGVIQVGANLGQEVGLFKRYTNNIILIEPIPQLAQYLGNNHPDCLVIPCALGSIDSQMDLHLASNNGESSSLLKPLNHTVYYPDISFEHDLEAIKGFGSYIQKIDLIIAEYINSNLYENDASLEDMSNYLIPLGFELVNTFSENLGAGNAVFKKR